MDGKLNFLSNLFSDIEGETPKFIEVINQMNVRQQRELGKLVFAVTEDLNRFYLLTLKFK